MLKKLKITISIFLIIGFGISTISLANHEQFNIEKYESEQSKSKISKNIFHPRSVDLDSDGDGLTDEEEIFSYFTDPNDSDSDDDGLSDWDEVKIHNTDPNDEDTDHESLTDYDEINIYNTDPNNADTDRDNLRDGREIYHKTNPLNNDTDGDGLSDGDEVIKYFTDPLNPDSDGDDISDGDEIRNKTNPLEKRYVENKLLTTLYFGAPFLSIVGVSVFLVKKLKKNF